MSKNNLELYEPYIYLFFYHFLDLPSLLSGSPIRNSVSPRSVAINAIRKRAEEDSSSSASSSSVKSTIIPLDVAKEVQLYFGIYFFKL